MNTNTQTAIIKAVVEVETTKTTEAGETTLQIKTGVQAGFVAPWALAQDAVVNAWNSVFG